MHLYVRSFLKGLVEGMKIGLDAIVTVHAVCMTVWSTYVMAKGGTEDLPMNSLPVLVWSVIATLFVHHWLDKWRK